MPTLVRITIFPIKSLDGVDVPEATILPSGALAGDRRYALVDAWGKFVSGKSCPAIHRIRARYSSNLDEVTLSHGDNAAHFEIGGQSEAIAQWCGDIVGAKCRLVENGDYGFPDDTEAPGPTLISTASLSAVADWFDEIDLAESRRRFRVNLEIDASPAFWEDRLVTDRQKIRRFQVGRVVLQGRGICERCVVPTRDALQGTVRLGFARDFQQRRETALPDWSLRERFDHFYRLAINTALDSTDDGAEIRLGDSVELIEDAQLGRRQQHD